MFFVQVEQLADDLESMGEPISKHRVMDIILSGMTNEYELIQFQAMKDSEFSLDDLKFTIMDIIIVRHDERIRANSISSDEGLRVLAA